MAGAPGQVRSVCGGGQPGRSSGPCRGQPRRALERSSGRFVGASFCGSVRDAFEFSGRLGIVRNRSGGEMPGMSFVVALGKHGGKSSVHESAFGRCGAVVNRRTDERMREAQVCTFSAEEPRVFRRVRSSA